MIAQFSEKLEKFSIWLAIVTLAGLTGVLPRVDPEYFNFEFKPLMLEEYYMPNEETEALVVRGSAYGASLHPLANLKVPRLRTLLALQKTSVYQSKAQPTIVPRSQKETLPEGSKGTDFVSQRDESISDIDNLNRLKQIEGDSLEKKGSEETGEIKDESEEMPRPPDRRTPSAPSRIRIE